MPYKPFPNQNQQFTPEEFLRYVRTNINNFVDTSNSHFSPSTITGYNETAIWNSSNPIEAIMHIDIITGHDGSVITTGHQINNNGMGGFSNGHWVFTTILAPWIPFTPGADGPHPVSGHRKFGLKKNAGGSYTIYTRGVDRIQDQLDTFIIEENDAFNEADNLWISFQQGLKNYIQANSYGNTVTVNTPIKWRPDWAEVKDVLINNKPLSDLGCN